MGLSPRRFIRAAPSPKNAPCPAWPCPRPISLSLSICSAKSRRLSQHYTLTTGSLPLRNCPPSSRLHRPCTNLLPPWTLGSTSRRPTTCPPIRPNGPARGQQAIKSSTMLATSAFMWPIPRPAPRRASWPALQNRASGPPSRQALPPSPARLRR